MYAVSRSIQQQSLICSSSTKYALPSVPKQFVSGGLGYGYGVGCGVGPFLGMGVGVPTMFGAGYGVGAYCGVGFGAGAVVGMGAMYMPVGVNWPFFFGPRLEQLENFMESPRTAAAFEAVMTWIEQRRNANRNRSKNGKGRVDTEDQP